MSDPERAITDIAQRRLAAETRAPLPAAPFRLLLEGRFDEWFGALQDDGQTLWILQHIPKTAGTSLRSELAERVRPQANICLNAATDTDRGGPKFANLDEALDHFESQLGARRFRFASGHLDRPQLLRLQTMVPRSRLFTVLREPVSRAVSDFRYQRTPKHPPHQAFIERYPTFADWVYAPDTQNRMFAFLRRSPQDSVEDVIADLEENYCFVGLTETYPLSRRVMFQWFGLTPPATTERRNETVASKANAIEDLESLKADLLQRNEKDVAIFRHLRKRLLAIREPMRDWLKHNRRT